MQGVQEAGGRRQEAGGRRNLRQEQDNVHLDGHVPDTVPPLVLDGKLSLLPHHVGGEAAVGEIGLADLRAGKVARVVKVVSGGSTFRRLSCW